MLLLAFISSSCMICNGYLFSLIELLNADEFTLISLNSSAATVFTHTIIRENKKMFFNSGISFIN